MAPVSMAAKQSSSNKDENHSSSSRKTTSARPAQEQSLKCPRCDSQNTKFCYYNNYSLTQPRHFCKTCRRYWTKGGALRNVPIGGGCRKNKKTKPSSRLNNLDSKDNTISSTDIGGLKFFHGLSPAMDFQLGGLSFPRLHSSPAGGLYNQFSSFGDIATTSCSIASAPCFTLDPSGSSPLMGFNFPFSSMPKQGENSTTAGFSTGEVPEMAGSLNHHHHTSLASSIESLSSINQDLHWKLQQQRLAMLFGGENQKENNVSSVPLGNQKPQPILFHNLETPKTNACGLSNDHNSSRKEGNGNGNGNGNGSLSTEWFFDNSYAPVTPTPTNSSSNGNDQNVNNWNGIQAWNNMSQYSAL